MTTRPFSSTRKQSISLSILLTIILYGMSAQSQADVTSFSLGFLGTTGPQTTNGYQTAFPGSYVDALSMDNARTYFQQDISSLSGTTINSATLDFFIGGGATDNVTVTLFDSAGTLGLHFDPPNIVTTELQTVVGSTNNSLDVAALLQTAIDSGLSHFALHFQGNTSNLFTQPAGGAVLVLNVDFSTAPPPSLGATAIPIMPLYFLLGLGFLLVLIARKRLV